MNSIKNFLREEEGAVAVEYAMLTSLVAIAIVVGATLLGKNICGILNGLGTFFGAVTPNGTATYAFTACVAG